MNFAILASPALVALVEFLKLESLKKMPSYWKQCYVSIYFLFIPYTNCLYAQSLNQFPLEKNILTESYLAQ